MEKEYNDLIVKLNNQIKEVKEKISFLEKSYEEKNREYDESIKNKETVEKEIENIKKIIHRLTEEILEKEYQKYQTTSYFIYAIGLAASLGIVEGNAIMGNVIPIDISAMTLGTSCGLGLITQAVGEIKVNRKKMKIIGKDEQFLELNHSLLDRQTDYEIIDKQIKNTHDELEKISLSKEKYIDCLDSLETEMFKNQIIALVNEENVDKEVIKSKKVYEKPMMRIRKLQ